MTATAKTKVKKKKFEGLIVSQSMIKDVRKYVLKKMCGLVLQSKYILNTWPEEGDDSELKKLGRYFEFILTGSTGRSGVVPVPDYKKGALSAYKRDPLRNRLTEDKMTKPYQLAHKNARRVKEYFRLMKIQILEVNVRFERAGMSGTIDIIALYNGHRVVIDVKYSGLLFDKYDELGWMWTDEQAKFHGTQAAQYHLLTGIPFYFLVVSSTNDHDIKFIDVQFDEFSLEQHQAEIEDTRNKMTFFVEHNGFHPIPELVRCTKCPLRGECKSKIIAPEPIKVRLVSNE